MSNVSIVPSTDKQGNQVFFETHENAIKTKDGRFLSEQLAEIDSEINAVDLKSIVTLTHSRSGTVHRLTGLSGRVGLVSCKFKATAGVVAGDSFTVDGVSYAARLTNGKALPVNTFVSGVVVDCVLDTVGKVVNFKAGGVDVSAATATPADVLSGKTFFAGLDTLRMGTLTKGIRYILIQEATLTLAVGETKRFNIPFEIGDAMATYRYSGPQSSFVSLDGIIKNLGLGTQISFSSFGQVAVEGTQIIFTNRSGETHIFYDFRIIAYERIY